MSATDTQILSAYDAAVREWVVARERIDRDGVLILDRDRLVPHPAIAVERSAAAEMRAWLPEVRRLRDHKDSGPGW